MDEINKTLGDREEGAIFYTIRNLSGATALLPGSKGKLLTSVYTPFCFRKITGT